MERPEMTATVTGDDALNIVFLAGAALLALQGKVSAEGIKTLAQLGQYDVESCKASLRVMSDQMGMIPR